MGWKIAGERVSKRALQLVTGEQEWVAMVIQLSYIHERVLSLERVPQRPLVGLGV